MSSRRNELFLKLEKEFLDELIYLIDNSEIFILGNTRRGLTDKYYMFLFKISYENKKELKHLPTAMKIFSKGEIDESMLDYKIEKECLITLLKPLYENLNNLIFIKHLYALLNIHIETFDANLDSFWLEDILLKINMDKVFNGNGMKLIFYD